MTFRQISIVRTSLVAFLSALLGFSYSITTQADSSAARENAAVAPRVVGSAVMRFTNPRSVVFPADFDLGDAFYGSVITRYITVTGGLRPYKFSTSSLSGLLGANSSLTLMQSGCLMGSVTNSTAATDIAFTVVATDSTELQVRDKAKPFVNSTVATRFHLAMYAGGAQSFRFGTDKLNDGVLGQGYAGKLDAIGGKGGTTYSILPGTITLDGQPFGTGASLESLGYSLAADGTVYGRPLKAGRVGFTARAKDFLNRTAKDRTNAVQDQIVSFNIQDTGVTSADNTIIKIEVKGNTAKLNTDSISFSSKFNLSGIPQPALNNARFAFLLGGNAYVGYLDSNGKVGNQLGRPLVLADGSVFTGKVDAPNGLITGKITKSNISQNIDAINIQDRSKKRLAVGIFLCDFVVASDLIDFSSKHVGTKYSLEYSAGHTGSPAGGNFQIVNVSSQDGVDIAGNPGSAWRADFVIQPRFGVDETAGFSNLSSIEVRINRNFVQQIPLSALTIDAKGNIVYKNTTVQNGIKSLIIKPSSMIGTVETFPISEGLTTLPPAKDSTNTTNQTFFNLAIDVNRVAPNQSFKGEASKAIMKLYTQTSPNYLAKTKWIDRNTKKR